MDQQTLSAGIDRHASRCNHFGKLALERSKKFVWLFGGNHKQVGSFKKIEYLRSRKVTLGPLNHGLGLDTAMLRRTDFYDLQEFVSKRNGVHDFTIGFIPEAKIREKEEQPKQKNKTRNA